jgi:uncharacterized membrane protein YphA (DoxX/SURF4 family)
MKKETYITVIASLFIILFLYAAVSKFMDYDKFESQIGQSPLIMKFNTILVWLVPSIEILIALLLIFPRTIRLGLYGSMIMMAIFTLYITFIMTFSPYVPCSCGGILNKMGWGEHPYLILHSRYLQLQVSTSKQIQQLTNKSSNPHRLCKEQRL